MAKVSRSDDFDLDIYKGMEIDTTKVIDKNILLQALESLPYPDKHDMDEFDRKIEMGTGLDPNLASGVHRMKTHSEIKELLRASQNVSKERYIKETRAERDKRDSDWHQKKLNMLAESKAAEVEVTAEKLELIKLRREIKRLEKNAEIYKLIEPKGQPKQKGDLNYFIRLSHKVNRADYGPSNIEIYTDLANALNILERKFGLIGNAVVIEESVVDEPIIETVKEELTLSKWQRTKLEVRAWFRSWARKVIGLLERV